MGITEHVEKFFRQGASRRTIRNVYETLNGSLAGRFHTYYEAEYTGYCAEI